MEPRPYAFHKMEALVKQMQDPETGVPVRSQKIFLTSVPSAFIGYDLIEWLMEHLNMEESGEAVHLANQLCQYGYLFPVTDCKTLNVKDDNSLYRFQTAYYWPWHHRNPDNVEYAIYLMKRTLRNKQRHALEDYEVETFNSLKRNLQNKWELVTMQAEEQAEEWVKGTGPCVKVGKERKKMDKLVADSQERAYWRVHRPPPGCQPPLEPSPITTLRRSTSPSSPNTEVELLRRQVSKSRVKVSQAVENLVTYSTTYAEYDPFFTQPQPSNPWLTDDPAFWQFNQPIVEVPTERRVKRWALSFEDLLSDPTGVEEFSNFLRKEYSHENIRFWLAVKELRYCAQSQVSSKVNTIYQEFLAHGAPCEVNIDSKTQESTSNEMKNPSRFTFDSAAHHVYTVLLNKDCYPRFVRSEQYKNLLANALHPPTKKRLDDHIVHMTRFFGFGGGGKKKSCAGSAVSTGGMNKRRGSDRSLTGLVHEAPHFTSPPQTHVPLSTSQSNLHNITISRDLGVSPERINVTYRDIKQKSMEECNKQSSDDELLTLSEGALHSKPGPSLKLSHASLEKVTNEEENPSEKESKPQLVESQENITVRMSVCGLDELKSCSSENLEKTTITIPIIETSAPPNNEEEVGSSESTVAIIEEHSTAIVETSQPDSVTVTPVDVEQVPTTSSEPKLAPCDTPPKTRKQPKKTRLLSEESYRSGVSQKMEQNKQISVDLVCSMGSGEVLNTASTSQRASSVEGVPEETKEGQQSRTDICPWEDEENCKTEEPFVKKYATLGYL
uniref:Regulator of G-protein signaling 7 n=1 Tax=Lygus hesperus TaxID=30085 RepID=A0A0K8SJH4_LYGHE